MKRHDAEAASLKLAETGVPGSLRWGGEAEIVPV